MVSLDENGLFCRPSILVLACATDGGAPVSGNPPPATPAAAPAKLAPVRNVRRFRYSLFGVISEDGISAAFLISMWEAPERFTLKQAVLDCAFYSLLDRTH